MIWKVWAAPESRGGLAAQDCEEVTENLPELLPGPAGRRYGW